MKAEPTPAIRLVLVDDHRIFRAGVRAELTEIDPRLDIVAEAGAVDSAITVIAETLPDVVLLDVHMPGGSGGEVRMSCAGVPVWRLRRGHRCGSWRCRFLTPLTM